MGVPITDAWSPRFTALFGWYVQRRMRKTFFAVRMLPQSEAVLQEFASQQGAALLAMNHASWWDPLTGILLHRMKFSGRSILAPMDAHELRRVKMLRWIGIFGMYPDAPNALEAMCAYVRSRITHMHRCSVILTPQGEFTDVREPVVPRPGAAAVLAAHADMPAYSLAIEYGFWSDARPEVFLSVVKVSTPCEPRRVAWQRALHEAMQSNQSALALAVRSRDASRFVCLLGGDVARVHPVYDAWLRMTGRRTGIDLSHRSTAKQQSVKHESMNA